MTPRSDDALAADRRARAEALDPQRSFLVHAPAGSGKTELLIQRYLRLLALVEHPESVLAITFTRKAAAEMRSRVLKGIAAGRQDQPPAEPHQRITWELGRAAAQRDQQCGWRLAENPQRVRVQTIDSLTSMLTHRMPWLSRMGAPPEAVEDAAHLYEDAARRTLDWIECEEYRDDLSRVLVHLDNNARSIIRLIVEMLAKRDQWLRHSGEIDRASLEAALAGIVRDGLETARRALPREEDEAVLAAVRFAAANLEEESPLPICGRALSIAPATPENLEAWLELRWLLLADGGTIRKRVDRRQGFPAKTAGKAAFESLLARLRERESEIEAAFSALDRLPVAQYSNAQWAALESLVRVLRLAVAMLHTVFRETGSADFTEFSLRAIAALGTEAEPTDLAYRLDARIEHLLVDEFQDTSYTHFRLLELLTANWSADDGRTAFLVGDAMQSIYLFREADVRLFLQAGESGLGSVRLERLQLRANFRSDGALIGWFNETFPSVLPPEADLDSGAVPYDPSEPNPARLGGMPGEIHLLRDPDPEEESRLVVALVQAARAQDPNARIAILLRGRAHGALVLPALAAAGFAYYGVDLVPLAGTSTIQDLFALCRAFEQPCDRTAWLALLRAPWCGLSLADLHTLSADAPATPVWDLLGDSSRLARLSADGAARATWFQNKVRPALENCGRRRWRESIEAAWLALGGPAAVDHPGQLQDAWRFFALLDETEDDGAPRVDALQPRIEKLWAAPDSGADPNLQVLTIHKAKGLEFDCVIVPGLEKMPPSEREPLLECVETGNRDAGQLLIAPIRAATQDSEPISKHLKGIRRERRLAETSRLLYVAATRARRSLHLIGSVKSSKDGVRKPNGDSLLAALWPVAESFVPERPEADDVPEAELRNPGAPIRRFAAGWEPPKPASPLAVGLAAGAAQEACGIAEITFDWAGFTARCTGTVVHGMLQRIATEGPAAWPAARVRESRRAIDAALAELGVPQAERTGAAGLVEQALLRTLSDERGRWILSPKHPGAACEYSLSGSAGGRGRLYVIDRTFLDELGTRWVIDYKTSAHLGAGLEAFLDNELIRYSGQLERYVELFRALEDRPVRAALYFPLYGGWRELETRGATGFAE